jgi:hypothetical protein
MPPRPTAPPPPPYADRPDRPDLEQMIADLERRIAELMAELRRVARAGGTRAEALRTVLVVIDTALDQVRRLLR